MINETIIKREDGTSYKISVNTATYSYSGSKISYIVYLYYREKGKRKWLTVPDTLSDYEYRKLDMEARRKHKFENMLRFVSKEEIYEAKILLWELLKPDFNHVN